MAVSRRTVLLSGFGAALLGALVYVSLRVDPVPVDLAVVQTGPFEVTVNADGFTKVRALYEIAAPMTGTALRSPVEEGDPVTGGETVVAIVEPATADLLDARTRRESEAALEEALAAHLVAEADLDRAREEQRFAETQFNRMQALVERGAASVTRLEDAEQSLSVSIASVAAAAARIEMAKGQIDRARARLDPPQARATPDERCCVRLTSPIDGVVLSVDRISSRPVVAGAPLVSVGDPQDLELIADILSSDAVRLPAGTKAYVERWGGDGALLAKLTRIDPKARTVVSALGIDEQRVDAFFDLVSPIEDRPNLGDGFSVFLRIVEWSDEAAMQIPLSALFRRGEGWAVFVAQDGRASLREITIGRRNDQMVVVEAGLAAGERVITHPSDAVADGARIAERTSL